MRRVRTGYHPPDNDLVLYHGDQSYLAGIVVLGRLDGDAAQLMSQQAGDIPASGGTR